MFVYYLIELIVQSIIRLETKNNAIIDTKSFTRSSYINIK